MQIQINSDNHISVDTNLSDSVKSVVEQILGRFDSHLTRVEVHLSDSNSHKPGLRDKHCLLEVRPAGRQPVTTSDEASSVEQAVRSAADKMRNQLDTLYSAAWKKSGSRRASCNKITVAHALLRKDFWIHFMEYRVLGNTGLKVSATRFWRVSAGRCIREG